ncbi:MAG: hypothetical protein ACI9MR_005240 [Myxococcota bacterium]|jgi:hypothetical protein
MTVKIAGLSLLSLQRRSVRLIDSLLISRRLTGVVDARHATGMPPLSSLGRRRDLDR